MVKHRKFKLHAGKSVFYYDVLVFETKTDMRDWCRMIDAKEGDLKDDYNFGARTSSWTHYDENDVVQRDIGRIVMACDQMRPATVVHELCHAAMRAFQHFHGSDFEIDDIEQQERVCYLMSDMWLELNTKFHNRGVWDLVK